MASSTEIKLKHVISICDTLDNLLKKSMGPNALGNLLSTDIGKLMVTTAGMPVLKSLNISHPIGRLLIASIQSHYNVTGDGSKTFILMVGEILKGIQQKMSREENIERLRYCRSLVHLKNVMMQIILPQVSTLSDRTELANVDVGEIVAELIFSQLQGNSNKQTIKHFTELLSQFILMSCETGPANMQKTVQFIIDNFDLIFLENRGISQLKSRIVDGIIITRTIVRSNVSHLFLKNVTFMAMQCSLETTDSQMARTPVFSGLKPDNLQRAFSWKKSVVKLYLSLLQKYEVSLILTTVHASEMLVHMCNDVGIKVVHCVDEEEIQYLSSASGVHIIHEARELFDLDQHLTHIGHADVCQYIGVSGQRCLQLVKPKLKVIEQKIKETKTEPDSIHGASYDNSMNEETPGKHAPICKQVLICGATPGMCSQYKSALFSALKGVYMWTDPLKIIPQKYTKVKVGCSDPDLTYQNYLVSKGPNSDNFTNREIIRASTKWAYALCSGGAFELLVHKCLKQFIQGCNDVDMQEIIQIVADSLLIVPFRLLQNSYAPAANRLGVAQLLAMLMDNTTCNMAAISVYGGNIGNTGINHDKQNDSPTNQTTCDTEQYSFQIKNAEAKRSPMLLLERYSQTCVHGINAQSGSELLHRESGIIEPLASKILLLYHVLDTVQQILRIHSMVSVTRLKPQHDDDDDDDDDDVI